MPIMITTQKCPELVSIHVLCKYVIQQYATKSSIEINISVDVSKIMLLNSEIRSIKNHSQIPSNVAII